MVRELNPNPGQQSTRKLNRDEIPKIKGCATMWHETGTEMAVMLKSIFRMDKDYSARLVQRSIDHLARGHF